MQNEQWSTWVVTPLVLGALAVTLYFVALYRQRGSATRSSVTSGGVTTGLGLALVVASWLPWTASLRPVVGLLGVLLMVGGEWYHRRVGQARGNP